MSYWKASKQFHAKLLVALSTGLLLAQPTLDAAICPYVLQTQSPRGGSTPVLTRALYDYAPSVMHDGQYRMWWCGGVAGDWILYSTANSLDGPWSAAQAVFQPSGGAAFDGLHTCDPSVLRVNGIYYMYYGGAPSSGNAITQVGVAWSTDGISWGRLNGGNPIVVPARPNLGGYGAGQPSVTKVGAYFYMTYTDSTGLAGEGQYVLRSTDPTFQSGVDELVGPGQFAARTPANHTTYRFLANFSADWQYIDMLDFFAITTGQPGLNSTIVFYDAALGQNVGSVTMSAPNIREGAAIVSRPDKHAVPSTQCGVVPLDIMTAVGPNAGDPFGWDLAHFGVNLQTNLSCSCSQLPKVFEDSLIQSPNLPWMTVKGGVRLHFALAGPALQLAKGAYVVSSEMYHSVPYGAALYANNAAYYTDGQPWAFLLDDGRLWPGSCGELFSTNGSSPAYLSPSQYASIPKGPALFCVR